jgi:MoaA/NifB/PqqE/SkfB family radical SAM enzyme
MGMTQRIVELLAGDEELARRLIAVRDFSRTVRAAEYHLTNACNLRCKGCWFFEYDFDRESRELTSQEAWKQFAVEQREKGVTAALIIGGEPSLFPERVEVFVSAMPYVTISSNGLKALPRDGFENVNVAITLFGGGSLDDDLRAIKPNGRSFTGLLDTALENYRNDDRVIFIYAITPEGLEHIEDTVRRIRDNGNQVTFNYYSSYGTEDPLHVSAAHEQLLGEALRMKEAYPETVVCDAYFIRTLITGRSHWASFGYEVCPSISVDHPDHRERLRNGNAVLPGFAAYAADAKTLNFCCTSGHCEGCRDSQAVFSWLLVSLPHFLDSKERLTSWVDMAESYWRQFVWSPFHPRAST